MSPSVYSSYSVRTLTQESDVTEAPADRLFRHPLSYSAHTRHTRHPQKHAQYAEYVPSMCQAGPTYASLMDALFNFQ
jgi:hypothetical protein